jgi:hypothetical protein
LEDFRGAGRLAGVGAALSASHSSSINASAIKNLMADATVKPRRCANSFSRSRISFGIRNSKVVSKRLLRFPSSIGRHSYRLMGHFACRKDYITLRNCCAILWIAKKKEGVIKWRKGKLRSGLKN